MNIACCLLQINSYYMPVYLGETATAKWALTFRMWWSFSHGTFSPRKGKQLCCSLGFPPGLHFQLLVNIAIWLQLFLVMIRSLVPAVQCTMGLNPFSSSIFIFTHLHLHFKKNFNFYVQLLVLFINIVKTYRCIYIIVSWVMEFLIRGY